MNSSILNRRMALLGGACALGGCSTLGSLNAAAKPLDTYDLRPVSGSKTGRKSSQTLLISRPQAPAALAIDRILIKPDPASITYLPNGRWSDEVPAVVQSLLIRSISQTGRLSYVGQTEAGPVPDKVMLTRIDAFEIVALEGGTFEVHVDINLTIINDRDQRIVASRGFSKAFPVLNEDVKEVVAVFQKVMNDLLPSIANWAVGQIARSSH